MAHLNHGQKRLADRLVVTKKFKEAKDGYAEFHFSWTNKGGKVWEEKMLLAVDDNKKLAEEFDINEYITHKEYCCVRRADKFALREIDS
jgi:hypothetical protein